MKFCKLLLWYEVVSLVSAGICAVRTAWISINIDTYTIAAALASFKSELTASVPTFGIIAIVAAIATIVHTTLSTRVSHKRKLVDSGFEKVEED